VSLQERLKEVVDFRKRNKNFRHALLDILLLSICAGRNIYSEIARYGQKKEFFCGVYYAYATAFLLTVRFAACFCIWIKKPLIRPLSTGSATLFQGSIGA
jgi:hypothetical protein